MTNRQDDTAPPDHPAKNTAKGDYEVGYGKPPVAHWFKPGNKANPKGRRKGSRNRKVVIREVLFEAVTVREGGEIKQMSALEAMLKKLVSKGLGGDHKAILEDAKRRLDGSALDNLPEDPAIERMNPEALGQNESVAP